MNYLKALMLYTIGFGMSILALAWNILNLKEHQENQQAWAEYAQRTAELYRELGISSTPHIDIPDFTQWSTALTTIILANVVGLLIGYIGTLHFYVKVRDLLDAYDSFWDLVTDPRVRVTVDDEDDASDEMETETAEAEAQPERA